MTINNGEQVIDLAKALGEMARVADMVCVVRCKDCKHRDPEDKKCDCGHDIQWQLPRSDEWFCADAERRGDTDDD